MKVTKTINIVQNSQNSQFAPESFLKQMKNYFKTFSFFFEAKKKRQKMHFFFFCAITTFMNETCHE